MFGSGCGPASFQTRPTSWRMNENPIAVMSGTRRGWLRSGLYPMRSIETLMTMQKSIEKKRHMKIV